MKIRAILLDLGLAIVLGIHTIVFCAMLATSQKFGWAGLLICSTIATVLILALWIIWGAMAHKRGLSARRARSAGVLPAIALWVWISYVSAGFMGGRLAPEYALIPALIALIALIVIAFTLSFRPTLPGLSRKLFIASIVVLVVVVLAWGLDAAFPPRDELVIHKAIKGGWQHTTAVKGIERFSQLKVGLAGWNRQAFAIPVNHGVQRVESVPPAGGVFKMGVGITRGVEGYQVSVFGMDDSGASRKVGVWYFRRDRTRWEDVQADASSFAGRQVRLIIQVASWNPSGGQAREDYSYVFFSLPRIVAAPPQNARNVVIILVDTLRADHTTHFGYKRNTTPFLAKLAGESATFTRAYSVTSWTAPTIASLFTGQLPHEHGVQSFETLPLSRDVRTLAEIFSDSGWNTEAVFGNPYIGDGTGFDQGFDQFAQLPLGLFQYGNEKWTTERAGERLKADPPQPFFMYIHYLDPHDPYTDSAGTPKWKVETSNIWKPLLSLTTTLYYHNRSDGIFRLGILRSWLLRALEEKYDEEVAAEDRGVERVLSILSEKGLLSNTVVALVADHGEEFMEHGGLIHGWTLYNESIHVPLMIRMPDGTGAGKNISNSVSILDVPSTVLRASGNGAILPGANLLAYLNETGAATNEVVCSELIGRVEGTRMRSVVRGNRKLILHEDTLGLKRTELYLLDEDPGEHRDKAADFPDLVLEMGQLCGQAKWPLKTRPDQMDPELRKKLKALGYIQR